MAWSMSNASSPRTSPMMMRSGRIRRQLISSCRWRIAPWPSTFGGRVSRRTMFSCASCNSAASSIVITRSFCGMYCERMFRNVVLPAPVPPEIRMLIRARTAGRQHFHHLRRDALQLHQLVGGQRPRFRNGGWTCDGPSSASGGMIALTREPSGRRASTIGEDSSTRRPTRDTMRSMICSRWRSSRNDASPAAGGRLSQ